MKLTQSAHGLSRAATNSEATDKTLTSAPKHMALPGVHSPATSLQQSPSVSVVLSVARSEATGSDAKEAGVRETQSVDPSLEATVLVSRTNTSKSQC